MNILILGAAFIVGGFVLFGSYVVKKYKSEDGKSSKKWVLSSAIFYVLGLFLIIGSFSFLKDTSSQSSTASSKTVSTDKKKKAAQDSSAQAESKSRASKASEVAKSSSAAKAKASSQSVAESTSSAATTTSASQSTSTQTAAAATTKASSTASTASNTSSNDTSNQSAFYQAMSAQVGVINSMAGKSVVYSISAGSTYPSLVVSINSAEASKLTAAQYEKARAAGTDYLMGVAQSYGVTPTISYQ
ncbi:MULTISPECIES: hypothetical protein [unclassified Lactococcus]|uniref:hypothetical protein n=1 Tax=unclassified Lactococcus TaxID=2643510 RepID=UPI0011CC6118|nr:MULTISPECIES: hypothetical protein [unclassified Lactococcus]MQW22574.1 hypothetical protein [Lactococcus sp. dk101]TXK45597.1 hypothetical protein FVP42_01275 [Lactococcus sp. dk310]TXK51447.1 hypothetical protein FVP43_01280 [Lactococcus sp. dk322]